MDVHPLTENVDLSAYAKSVDSDRTAVKHFKALNELWGEVGKYNMNIILVRPLPIRIITD